MMNPLYLVLSIKLSNYLSSSYYVYSTFYKKQTMSPKGISKGFLHKHSLKHSEVSKCGSWFSKVTCFGTPRVRHLHQVFEDELMDARIAAELMGNAPVGLRNGSTGSRG